MTVGPLGRDDETATFLDGTARGELLLRRCRDGHWSEPAAMCCSTCCSAELAWEAASGTASLVSWAVTHSRPTDGTADTHRVLAVVELAEGPWWWTSLADVAPEEAVIGLHLQVAFERASDGDEAVPVFRPR
jgi:uncharacterized OB-fold protein